jgi:hypothetical protein
MASTPGEGVLAWQKLAVTMKVAGSVAKPAAMSVTRFRQLTCVPYNFRAGHVVLEAYCCSVQEVTYETSTQ